MESFASFVAFIRSQPVGSIHRLVIVDHGYPGAHEFGPDILRVLSDPATGAPRFVRELRASTAERESVDAILASSRPYFAADATLELHGCNTGYGETGYDFVRGMARVLGVTVRAGGGYQLPTVDGFEGTITRCTASAAAHWLTAARAYHYISHPLSIGRAAARAIAEQIAAGVSDVAAFSAALELIVSTGRPQALDQLGVRLASAPASIRASIAAALAARFAALGETTLAARANAALL